MYTIQLQHGNCRSCRPLGGTAALSSSVSGPLHQHQGLHMSEECGGDPSPGAGCGGYLKAGVPVWWATGEKVKKEVLEDRGDRLWGEEKWGPNDGKEGEVAYVEKQGESQGDGGGDACSWHGVEQRGWGGERDGKRKKFGAPSLLSEESTGVSRGAASASVVLRLMGAVALFVCCLSVWCFSPSIRLTLWDGVILCM